MNNNKGRGFTLVELLAVIVILAVILIIAMPKISDVIKNSKEASLETTAKLIASQAEKKYTENQVLDNSSTIKCSDVAKISDADYASCTITFDDKGNVKVKILGKGKFDGMAVCNANKNSATISSDCSTAAKYFSYEDVEGGISITDYNIGYNVDVTVKDQSKCESYLASIELSQEEATTICTGGDLDGCTLKDAVQQGNILSSDYEVAGIEVKWLDTYVDGGGEDVVIPSELDGKKVVAISANAFESKEIKSVIIPDGVTSIGDSAFARNQLTNVTIPESVTSIGNNAFQGNKLTNVVIPDSVTSIGDSAFARNQLTNVVIPNTITSIGDSAFARNQLTNVTIPESVTSIGNNAFQGNKLTNVTIPSSVTSIGKRAFAISCSTDTCVNSVCTCTKVGDNDNPNLSKIVNKTGKAFDWDLIINNSSKGRYTFVTGDVVSDNKENHIVSIVSE